MELAKALSLGNGLLLEFIGDSCAVGSGPLGFTWIAASSPALCVSRLGAGILNSDPACRGYFKFGPPRGPRNSVVAFVVPRFK